MHLTKFVNVLQMFNWG